MKIGKWLNYLEIMFIIGVIITPIVFFTSPLSVELGHGKVGFREGDIVQLTIDEYSFDYNLSSFENYNVTAGIYLNPAFNFKEGVTYTSDNISMALGTIKLFEGNSTSLLQFNFSIESISKTRTGALVTLENTNRSFTFGVFYIPGYVPFFKPSLAIGLTFTSDSGGSTTSYIHWRSIYLFSTKRARDALNWQSKNSLFPIYNFAREDRNTFNSVYHNQDFFSITTYRLKARSNKLQEVNSYFMGREMFQMGDSYFSSNITQYLGLPYYSDWFYDIDLELRYFRGGREI